jgi:hypothetical protein
MAGTSSALPKWRWLGWGACVAAAAILVRFALVHHPVGDYQTESDFYGAYAGGAREIQRGHLDAGRYSVIGPGYELVLALVGLAIPDLFTAAKLLSVVCAAGILLLWRDLADRRLGARAAFWTVLFLAANAVFFRYGYSATTDMLACFLIAGAIFMLLVPRWRLAACLSGTLAGLATLTRYNAIALVPAALICIAAGIGPAHAARLRSALIYLLGFIVTIAPWTAYSLGHGKVPGAALAANFGFYQNPGFSRNTQDAFDTDLSQPMRSETLADRVTKRGGSFVASIARNIPDHLVRDARELLGWPVAALCIAGLAVAVLGGGWRDLTPVACFGGLIFLSLVPVFYSDRYSLPLAPIYLMLAGVAIAPRLIRPVGRWVPRTIVWAVAAIALAFSIQRSVALQHDIAIAAPIETIQVGHVLARRATTADRVASRKGHVGYYSGVPVVPFPRVKTLGELASFCRAQGATYLYYSWYEVGLRPEFSYLLDTTAAIPGLAPVHTTSARHSVLFAIGREFGREPTWMSDSFLVQLHKSRALVGVLPDSLNWSNKIVLAVDALGRGAEQEALALADAATRTQPREPLGWIIKGAALRVAGRLRPARQAYARALALEPSDADTRYRLGGVERQLGMTREAGRTWKPMIEAQTDRRVLLEMKGLYESIGDREAIAAVRSRLREVGGLREPATLRH